MAILSTAKIVGMLASAKKTGKQILNAAGEYVAEVVEDFLYSENNKLKAEKLELIKKNYELELRLKKAELKKCDVRGCANRQPPSDY